jgi:hypothetical protein
MLTTTLSLLIACQTGIENKHFKWDQAKEAFTDVKSLLLFQLGVTGNNRTSHLSSLSS